MIKRYKRIFISDIHLGTRVCNINELLEFLKEYHAEEIYLVGDIIDFWKLRSGWYWPERHNEFIRDVLKIAKQGTKVFYIPGNHDEIIRKFGQTSFGDITICDHVVIEDFGSKIFVTHGDQADTFLRTHKGLAIVGSHLYDWSVYLNYVVNKVRRMLGRPYWSLSGYLKSTVKQATKVIENFSEILVNMTISKKCDTVICGHIHAPKIAVIRGIRYINCGDWTEHNSAILQDYSGNFTLLGYDVRL